MSEENNNPDAKKPDVLKHEKEVMITFRRGGVHTTKGKIKTPGEYGMFPKSEAQGYLDRDWAVEGKHPERFKKAVVDTRPVRAK